MKHMLVMVDAETYEKLRKIKNKHDLLWREMLLLLTKIDTYTLEKIWRGDKNVERR